MMTLLFMVIVAGGAHSANERAAATPNWVSESAFDFIILADCAIHSSTTTTTGGWMDDCGKVVHDLLNENDRV